MNPIVHADDFGNSLHMSEVIAACYRDGVLTSTSVMITADKIDQSLEVLRTLPGIQTSLHLNIAEGKPVSPPTEIPYLVNEEGEFHRGFATVVRDYYLGSRRKREAIRQQIRHEFHSQIIRYTRKLQVDTVRIDSHQHYHTIPFVADIVMELAAETNIGYVRLPDEPFFVSLRSWGDLRNYFGVNLIKHVLLNALSRGLRRKLDRHGIAHNDCFVGVLFTGNVTLDSIGAALKKCPGDRETEILLHPGSLSPEEAAGRKRDTFTAFYTHPHRKREEVILRSEAFRKLLSSLV